jgi:hypothetical protein
LEDKEKNNKKLQSNKQLIRLAFDLATNFSIHTKVYKPGYVILEH